MANHYANTENKEIEININVKVRIDAFGGSKSTWNKDELQARYDEMIADGSIAKFIEAHIKNSIHGVDQIYPLDGSCDLIQFDVESE